MNEIEGLLGRLVEPDIVRVASVADMEPRLREQVLAILPGARSAIALAAEIYPEVLDHSRPRKTMGEATAQDMLGPHMDFLNGRITKAAYDIARLSRRLGYRALVMPASGCPTDPRYLTAILSYKHVGEAAGLGAIGRHSLLVTPEFGPRVRLACALTEAELTPSARRADDLCNECNNCVAACPSGALSEPEGTEPYSMNKYACSAYRAGAGGCSECMRVCPQGR